MRLYQLLDSTASSKRDVAALARQTRSWSWPWQNAAFNLCNNYSDILMQLCVVQESAVGHDPCDAHDAGCRTACLTLTASLHATLIS